MQEVNLGQVGIVSKGVYSDAVTYLPLNTVSLDGGTWICIKNSTGIKPGESPTWETYWLPFANGVKSVTVEDSATAGKAQMTITYTSGQTVGFEFSTAVISPDSVDTAEIKNNAVTTPKVKDEAITEPKLAANAVTSEYTGALLSAGWSASGSGFVQSVDFAGLKGQNPVIPDLDRTNLTGEELANASDAYANILKVTTTDGSAEYYSSEQPEIDLPVKLLEVKK